MTGYMSCFKHDYYHDTSLCRLKVLGLASYRSPTVVGWLWRCHLSSLGSQRPSVSMPALETLCFPYTTKTLLYLHFPLSSRNIRMTDSGLVDIRDALPDPCWEKHRESLFPIERASCHFLFAVSEDDHNWNSALFARRAAERLRDHGKETFKVLTYPKAGHFLEVPHMPYCPSGFHAAVRQNVVFGGEPKAHSDAQLDLWGRVQEFFKSHLINKSP